MNPRPAPPTDPGQSFPLSLCGPHSICRANAHMVYGLKHQHFTLRSITVFMISFALDPRWFVKASKILREFHRFMAG